MKPVAWITKSCKCYSTPLVAEAYNNKEELIPVYTAPRELSDDEINKLWTDSYDFNGRFCVYEFARAILKKASEK